MSDRETDRKAVATERSNTMMTVYGIEMNAHDFTEMVKAITAEWDAMDAWDRDDFDDFDDFKDIKIHSYLYSED